MAARFYAIIIRDESTNPAEPLFPSADAVLAACRLDMDAGLTVEACTEIHAPGPCPPAVLVPIHQYSEAAEAVLPREH